MKKRGWRWLLAGSCLAAMLARLAATPQVAIPSFAAVRAAWQPSDAVLLDRHGTILQRQRENYAVQRLDWVALADVSPAVSPLLLQAEDRRFRDHDGIDFRSLAGALRDRLLRHTRRGASTLDMQLAAELIPGLAAHGRHHSLLQKLRQMRAATALDAHWSKDQILEAYLNLTAFRGETQGIAAASDALFGKSAAGLDSDEAALLVALLPAPAAPATQVAARACALLRTRNPVDCRPLAEKMASAGRHEDEIMTADRQAPQFARLLLHTAGERRVSTLDAAIQRTAQAALERQLRQLGSESVRDAAAVVLDNASGDVLAYVGSAGDSSRAPEVDGVRALRQAGSTLKPFLYELAVERRLLTAASLLNDSPIALDTGAGLYTPQDYEPRYEGLVSARTALAGSLNIPAVRTLMLVGTERFRERLHDLGYVGGLTEDGDYYGYSLALGSAEVSLLEQANAYRTLANAGRYSALRLTPDTAPPAVRQVLSADATWIIGDILSDRAARAITFGLDSALGTPYWSAVKTGTSKNMRDNWCLGFSSRYTVGVWVGNFEGDPMRTVSGVTGAAPAWREIMDALNDNDAPATARPTAPPGILDIPIRYANGLESPRQEWFLAGTGRELQTPLPASPARPRIVSPSDGAIIALDPDIPLQRQHVLLQARPALKRAHWLLDGKRLAGDTSGLLWTPLPGSHVLALANAEDVGLDEVAFKVRPLGH